MLELFGNFKECLFLKNEVMGITPDNYGRIRRWFFDHKKMHKALLFCYKFVPLIIFVAYPIFVLIVMIYNDLFSANFMKVILVPLGVFLGVSLFRKFYNAPRPYEVYSIKPLVKPSGRGESFPSRHSASAFVIAMAMLYINHLLGVIFLMLATIVALSRFFGGVHFLKDIFVGSGIGILCGIIFMFII